MALYSLIILAIGLSMDSFAVSISSGIAIKKFRFFSASQIAFFMAFFQGGMPLIGWWLGVGFRKYIVDYDHWIAFFLLLMLGLKMIYEGIYPDKNSDNKRNPLNIMVLITLAIATSIDALAVGVGLAFLDISMLHPVLIIAFTTFIFSFLGVWIGTQFGRKFNSGIEIAGGIILIFIGTKILVEHTLLAMSY